MGYVTIDGYSIDASVSEQHSFDSEVTEFPVESGSNITDNVRPKPIKITIEGVVSDTPIGKIADLRFRDKILSDSDDPFVPSEDALAHLLKVRDSREPVTVETSLKRFDSMVLTSLDIPRTSDTGHALKFTAAFQQVLIITNLRTVVRVAAPQVFAAPVKKTAGKSVIEFRESDGSERVYPTTRSGKGGVWNNETKRYEYSAGQRTDEQGYVHDVPSGKAIPPSDLDAGATEAAQLHQDKTAREAQEEILRENSTYYDRQRDEWVNTDGTPVTQEQLDAKRGSVPRQGD